MPKLVLMFREKMLEAYPLAIDEKLTIGRNNSNAIVIDNLAVSGYHAVISMEASGPRLSDTDSKNGTWVNHQKVSECQLNHKDLISIGKHALWVDLKDEIDVPEASRQEHPPEEARMTGTLNQNQTISVDTPPGETPPPSPEPVRPQMDKLFILAGGDGDVSLCGGQNFSIGRNGDADIVVGGLWGLLMGSPAAVINKRAGDYFLRFTGGLIKPKRNGAGVKGTIKLNNDDVVSLGPVQVQLQLRA